MIILVLAVMLLPSVVVDLHSASALSASTPNQSTSTPFYLVKDVINTTSDWLMVKQRGLSPFVFNASILAGQDAPDLSYHAGPDFIHIVKQQYDTTAVTLEFTFLTTRGDDSGVISIESGAIGGTVIDLYYYDGTWINIGTVTDNHSSDVRNFTVDYGELYASPSIPVSMEPVPSNLNNTVSAFYYTWYGSPNGPDGQLRHWDLGYAHEPTLGRYDSTDERIIEAHIRMAKSIGIDCLIVNFNGMGSPEEKAAPSILNFADSLGLNVSFYECVDRPDLTPNEVVNELAHIVQTYSSHKSFLKANGLPVIYLYAVGAGNRTESFWPEVARGLKERGAPAYLVGDLIESRYVEAFDGCHRYGAITPSDVVPIWQTLSDFRYALNGIDWEQAVELIQQGESLPLKERYLALPVHPGYDATKIIGYEEHYTDPYLDRKNGQTYDEYWQAAMSCHPDAILITSWNEWHEGSEIEPSVEYGFTYTNLTRQYVSLFKGTTQPLDSTNLRIQSGLGNVLRYGSRSVSISATDTSPSVQSVYVNLSISSSEGLDLTQVTDIKGLYCYNERILPHAGYAVIPLIRPGETITVNVSIDASVGARTMTVNATGYSPSGVPTTALISDDVHVVFDRVVVNLVASTSRAEVGSEASIIESAYYEYDHTPFSGTIHLNDTLMKNSMGMCSYTVSSVSDDLYDLTGFVSNEAAITFDRIVATSAAETIGPGSVSIKTKLTYESDGQPVDNATVLANGVPMAETTSGTFQTTVATWSPLFVVNVTVERTSFSNQETTLSGLAAGNTAVLAAVIVALLAATILLIRRRRG